MMVIVLFFDAADNDKQIDQGALRRESLLLSEGVETVSQKGPL